MVAFSCGCTCRCCCCCCTCWCCCCCCCCCCWQLGIRTPAATSCMLLDLQFGPFGSYRQDRICRPCGCRSGAVFHGLWLLHDSGGRTDRDGRIARLPNLESKLLRAALILDLAAALYGTCTQIEQDGQTFTGQVHICAHVISLW